MLLVRPSVDVAAELGVGAGQPAVPCVHDSDLQPPRKSQLVSPTLRGCRVGNYNPTRGASLHNTAGKEVARVSRTERVLRVVSPIVVAELRGQT